MTANTEKHIVIILTTISINLSLILAFSAYAERPVESLGSAGAPYDQITERLALSEELARQIRPILQESREKMSLLRGKYQEESRSPSAMVSFRKEREELRQEGEEKLATLLSDKQMMEYQKMQYQEREKMRQGPGGNRSHSGR